MSILAEQTIMSTTSEVSMTSELSITSEMATSDEMSQTNEIAKNTFKPIQEDKPIEEDNSNEEDTEDVLFSNISKTKVEWHEFPHSIKVSVNNLEPYILSVGDFITFEGRTDTGVIIVKIYGYKEESGPRCMTYLPWRDETGRWATRLFSLRGDPRSIICYPEGTRHYGQHINWATIKNMNHMAPTSNSAFQNMLRSLRNPESELE